MDKQYNKLCKRIVNNHNLYECSCGYPDSDDCSWYHGSWLKLRLLGMVSNPFWHTEFYVSSLQKYCSDSTKVLVLGTADFSMPLLCQNCGIKHIDVCDICETPLNICKSVSESEAYGWNCYNKNIYRGLDKKYDIIINDAFLTRFSNDEKKTVLSLIHKGLHKEGMYITTIRTSKQADSLPLFPSEKQKNDFITRTIKIAKNKKLSENIEELARNYINQMQSFPLKSIEELKSLLFNLFYIEYTKEKKVKGECAETTYIEIVLRKTS